MDSVPFMSTAPRPFTHPSAISPEKGWSFHSAGSAGTTSRWPWISRASGLSPGMRATTLVRRGADSNTVGSMPMPESSPATYSAAGRSPEPSGVPSLVVSILSRSEQMLATSVTFFLSASAAALREWGSRR